MTEAPHQAAERRGRRAERWAVLLLRLKGYRILARRWRSVQGSGAGEIDLIVRRGRLVAFVEVKARPIAADAALALSPRQQARIARGAETFLKRNPAHAGCDLRFDVVLVVPGRLPMHIADAWRIS